MSPYFSNFDFQKFKWQLVINLAGAKVVRAYDTN